MRWSGFKTNRHAIQLSHDVVRPGINDLRGGAVASLQKIPRHRSASIQKTLNLSTTQILGKG